MPSKEATLVNLNKHTYSKSEVQHLINGITHIESRADSWKNPTPKDNRLKKGDVFCASTEAGNKPRPYVICKVLEETVIAIPLSTTEDCLCMSIRSTSRFFKEGFFSKQFITLKKDMALKNWVGIYDNNKKLNKAIKELKEYLNNEI